MIVHVRDVHLALRVDGDAPGKVELSCTASRRAPLAQERAGTIELLDTIVSGIGNVERSAAGEAQTSRAVELSISRAWGSPLQKHFGAVWDGVTQFPHLCSPPPRQTRPLGRHHTVAVKTCPCITSGSVTRSHPGQSPPNAVIALARAGSSKYLLVFALGHSARSGRRR